jgi:hypothetical protein
MTALRRIFLCAALATAPLLALSGCATVGVMASSTQSFSLTDTVTVKPTDATRFFAGASSVGSSLGLRVAGEDRTNNAMQFAKGASEFTQVMIGKIERMVVTVSLSADHKTVSLKADAMGNFDSASQASVTKVIGDFKAGLVAQFGSPA